MYIFLTELPFEILKVLKGLREEMMWEAKREELKKLHVASPSSRIANDDLSMSITDPSKSDRILEVFLHQDLGSIVKNIRL